VTKDKKFISYSRVMENG